MSPEATCGRGVTAVKPELCSPNGIQTISADFVQRLKSGEYNEDLKTFKYDFHAAALLLTPPSRIFLNTYGVCDSYTEFMITAKDLLKAYSFYTRNQIPLVNKGDYEDKDIFSKVNWGIEVFKIHNPEFCDYAKTLIDERCNLGSKDILPGIETTPEKSDILLSMFGLMEAKAARDKAQV